MVKVYLLIELLRAANAADVVVKLNALELEACRFANAVVLADDKIVAQLDCETGAKANTAIVEKMGLGIWSMHFIGMLAFQLPIPMSYDLGTTTASLIVAIIVSAFALHFVSRRSVPLPACRSTRIPLP